MIATGESLRWTAGQTTSLEISGYAVAKDGTVHDHLAQLALQMSRHDRAGSPAFPFQVGDKAFLPRASLETQSGASEKLVLLAYEPLLPGDPVAPLQISSTLRDRQDRLVPAGLLRIEKVHRGAPGRRTYVLGFVPEPLAAGDYTLRIGIGEGGSQLEAYSLLRVRAGS